MDSAESFLEAYHQAHWTGLKCRRAIGSSNLLGATVKYIYVDAKTNMYALFYKESISVQKM